MDPRRRKNGRQVNTMAETKVKVRLDTRVAKKALVALTKQAKATSGRVASELKGAVTSGFGMGAGFGAGVAAIKGATAGGVGDVVRDSLGGYGAELSEFLLGDLDDAGRAKKATRDEIADSFASVVSRQGGISPSIKGAFENLYTNRLHEEIGKGVIEREEAFGGKAAGEMVDKISSSIKDALKEAADYLLGKMPSSGK